MKKLHLFLIMFILFIPVRAQDKISYAYDASGNRTERVMVLTKSATVTTQEVFTDTVKERQVKIYPNPTKGLLKVEIPESEDIKNCTISINSIASGRLVMKKKATFPTTDIDISSQQDGFYIMVIDIDGHYTTWKIMKN